MRSRSNNFRLLDLPNVVVQKVLNNQFDVVSFAQCSQTTHQIVQNFNFKTKKFTIRHTEHRHYVSFKINQLLYVWEFVDQEQLEKLKNRAIEREREEEAEREQPVAQRWKKKVELPTFHRLNVSTNLIDDTEHFRAFALNLFPTARSKIFQITPLGLLQNFQPYYLENITHNPDLEQIVLGDDDITSGIFGMKLSKFPANDFRFAVDNTPTHAEFDIIGYPERHKLFADIKLRHETVVLYSMAPFLKCSLICQLEARECLVMADFQFNLGFVVDYIKMWLRHETSPHTQDLHVALCLGVARYIHFVCTHFDYLPISEEHKEVVGFSHCERCTFDLVRDDGEMMSVVLKNMSVQIRIWN